MASRPDEEGQRPVVPTAAPPSAGWRQVSVASAEEGERVAQQILTAMEGLGYAARARERVGLALREAVPAALRCGEQPGISRPCQVGYRVAVGTAVVEVEGRAGPPDAAGVQGPHGARLLQPVGGYPAWQRVHTWLRCRPGGQFERCTFVSLP